MNTCQMQFQADRPPDGPAANVNSEKSGGRTLGVANVHA